MNNIFDQVHEVENAFVKSNPHFLKSMFGVEEAMPLWIADMDFKVANPIREELKRISDRGIFAYEFSHNDVFRAIRKWNEDRHGLVLEEKNFISVSGVLTGISVLVRQLSNEGDGVLIQTPVYHQFQQIIKTSKRKVVQSELKRVGESYQMDFDDIESKLKSENVKIIILCNPHNPVGRVWKKEELSQLISLANQYGVTIISDEIHSDIVYSKAKFSSLASFEGSENHVTVIGSPAKTFGMQSISEGYLYIPNEELHERIKAEVSAMYLDHGNALTAYATIAAYTKGAEWLDSLMEYLEKTVEWIEDYVQENIPQLKVFIPEGTYQIWIDFSAFVFSNEELHQRVFHEAGLALTPGSWFSEKHSQFMRMNIASPLEMIQKAFYQLKKSVAI